jgi:hypothetical protein
VVEAVGAICGRRITPARAFFRCFPLFRAIYFFRRCYVGKMLEIPVLKSTG